MRFLENRLFLTLCAVIITALILAGCGKYTEQIEVAPSETSTHKVEGATSAETTTEVEAEHSVPTQASTVGTVYNTDTDETKPTAGSTKNGTTSTTMPSIGATTPTGNQPTTTTPPTTEPPITDFSTTAPSSPITPSDCAHINSRKATCVAAGYCWDCNSEIEEINPNVHPKGQELGLYDEKEATCAKEGYTGDLKCMSCHVVVTKGKSIPKLTTHVGGTASCNLQAICSECGKAYGNYDKSNHIQADHTVNWERRNEIPSTCMDGYSGDLYCLDCGTLVEKGKTIPPMGCVEDDAVPATCCTYSYCTRCGVVWDWMGYDKSNHKGGTEVRDTFPSSYPCCNGYSGDTYCLGCNAIISKGQSTPATQDHSYQEVSRIESTTEISITSQCTVCGTTSKVSISIG